MSDTQVIEQLNTLQRKVEDIYIPEGGVNLVAPFLDLPAKVGVWYAGDVERSTGNINEAQGKALQLSYGGGGGSFSYTDTGVAYADFDGWGWWGKNDETDLDVLGTEAWSDNPGLTVICWAAFKALGWEQMLISKNTTAGNQRAWILDKLTGPEYPLFAVSTDGAVMVDVISTVAVPDTNPHFFCGRFVPSTSVDVWMDSTKTSELAGVPASIFNSSAPLVLGAMNAGGAAWIFGKIYIAAVCASALSDGIIQSIFQRTRPLFGL